MEKKLSKLKNLLFFQDFTDYEIERMLKLARFKSFRKDECIFSEGDESPGFYLILEGIVEVIIRFSREEGEAEQGDGDDQKLVQLSSGDIIGELGLFGKVTHQATFRAFTSAQLLFFNRDLLSGLEDKFSALLMKIYKKVGQSVLGKMSGVEITWSVIIKRAQPPMIAAKEEVG